MKQRIRQSLDQADLLNDSANGLTCPYPLVFTRLDCDSVTFGFIRV